MQKNSIFRSRMAVSMVCGTVLAAGVLAIHAKADQWDKKTVLTVNEPIQVRDTVLEPGKYVFKLYDSSSDRHVVQIFNADQTHIITTILAIPAERLNPTGKTKFTFWETPAGTAKAMRTWYYPGDNFGQEFPYPKHLLQLAMAQPPAPAVDNSMNEATPAPGPQAAAQEPTPVPVAAPETPAEQPTEVAQSTPAPAPEVQPEPQPTQRELPKTASPFPLIGLSGIFSLAIFGLLRLRSA
jgi:hypothetical protein